MSDTKALELAKDNLIHLLKQYKSGQYVTISETIDYIVIASAQLEQLKAENKELGTVNVNFANQVIQLLTEQTQLRAERDAMREALETYEYAIREAEAILGGEYAMEYGPFFEMVKSARAILAKYPAHPKKEEK
jgi:FtsZ-binding cell division protein ZapB